MKWSAFHNRNLVLDSAFGSLRLQLPFGFLYFYRVDWGLGLVVGWISLLLLGFQLFGGSLQEPNSLRSRGRTRAPTWYRFLYFYWPLGFTRLPWIDKGRYKHTQRLLFLSKRTGFPSAHQKCHIGFIVWVYLTFLSLREYECESIGRISDVTLSAAFGIANWVVLS